MRRIPLRRLQDRHTERLRRRHRAAEVALATDRADDEAGGVVPLPSVVPFPGVVQETDERRVVRADGVRRPQLPTWGAPGLGDAA